MSGDRTCEAPAAAAACPPPTSAAGVPLPGTSASVPPPLGEPQPDSHAQVKRRFLIEPDLPRQVIDELLEQLAVLFADDLLQVLDYFLLALYIGRSEQLVLVERVEQLVVLGGALFLDVAEAGVAHTALRQLDPLGSGARDVH